jgi:hypothetical protein
MPISDEPRERIQISLRGLFVVTLLVAIAIAVGRRVLGLIPDPRPLVAPAAMGVAVGWATVSIVRNVLLTCLLSGLWLVFIVMGAVWFSGGAAAYGCGLAAGAALGWKGLPAINTLFRWCGLSVSKTDPPARRTGEEDDRAGE